MENHRLSNRRAEMKLLLTGFEPFGDFATNPSWDALQLAARKNLFKCEVVLARLPVAYSDVFAAWKSAASCKPDGAISFGLHGGLKGRGAAVIYIETTARNRDGANKSDNAGVKRRSRKIIGNGPDTLAATFPAATLKRSLRRAGFEAQLSDNAGAYLCNHIFYRALRSSHFAYGFVHVPPVNNMGGVLTLNELARAVARIVNALASKLARSGKLSRTRRANQKPVRPKKATVARVRKPRRHTTEVKSRKRPETVPDVGAR
jgi:pyroglutamyl-peptidase